MNRVVKYYLYLLPFLSLVGILVSCFRVTYSEAGQDRYTEAFLTASAGFDLLIILAGFKHLLKNKIVILLLLLTFSFIVGALNNEISRRFITDFTNPFFFFGKCFIFARYWLSNDFSAFKKYYTRVAVVGSTILLPVIYFLFQ